MGENEIIVSVGRDLFSMGVTLGFGISAGVLIAIGFYAIVCAAGAWLCKMWHTLREPSR